MDYIAKAEIYDKFSCIADRCPFSCCKGWDITVDPDTYQKWNSDREQGAYLCKYVKVKNSPKKAEYYMKLNARRDCYFLNEKGLCNIIISCKEDFLPKTCRIFPRLSNSFGSVKEYSLSCACPAVVDMINQLDGNIRFLWDGDSGIPADLPAEYKIRDAMISIMQNSSFSLRNRILLVFYVLLVMQQEPVITDEIISRCRKEKYLLSLTGIWSKADIAGEASYAEVNELFLDITQNYKKEKNYSIYLKDISELAEAPDGKNHIARWDDFTQAFSQYGKLLENCLVSKIYADCTGSDIDDMIMSFQMIVTEFVMIRYSAFLSWLKKEGFKNSALDYADLRDYITVYSRIIGYNPDGIREFWKDSFDEAIWDFGYLLLLMNQ